MNKEALRIQTPGGPLNEGKTVLTGAITMDPALIDFASVVVDGGYGPSERG